jgi:hypothetical protein
MQTENEYQDRSKIFRDPRDESLLISAVMPALVYGVLVSSFNMSSGKAFFISGLLGAGLYLSDRLEIRSAYTKLKVVGNDFFSSLKLVGGFSTSYDLTEVENVY